jgi:two-component system, NarL family, sensor kinase
MTALSAPAADGSTPSAASARPQHEPDGSVDDPASAMPTVVLSSPGQAVEAGERIRPRRIAGQLAAAAVIVVVLVGVVGALVSRQVAQRQAVHDVAELTDVLAQSALTPALTDAMTNDPAAARALLDPLVRRDVLSADLVRVKLWTPAGLILYSDEPQLIGKTFALDDEARAALTAPQTDASVSDLARPENQFERSQGKLLEVYRPVWTPGGHPLLFETYFRYDIVNDRSHGLWLGFAGIIVSSLAALLLLLTPIVWSLLGRARRAQEQRQAMMGRALAASDAERARIAASLHDGVVQDLIASSLQLSGQAQRAAAIGDDVWSSELSRAAGTLRSSVGGLRSLLVEIYPPNLAQAGLTAALSDLAATRGSDSATVRLDLDPAAIGRLSPVATEAVYQVVQETIRNTSKHAGPAAVSVRIYPGSDSVNIDIDDDGAGFDPASLLSDHDDRGRSGHLGLRLIADAANRAGAELSVAAGPGAGTHYRMRVPVQ